MTATGEAAAHACPAKITKGGRGKKCRDAASSFVVSPKSAHSRRLTSVILGRGVAESREPRGSLRLDPRVKPEDDDADYVFVDHAPKRKDRRWPRMQKDGRPPKTRSASG